VLKNYYRHFFIFAVFDVSLPVNWCDKLRYYAFYICSFIASFGYRTMLVSKQPVSRAIVEIMYRQIYWSQEMTSIIDHLILFRPFPTGDPRMPTQIK